MSSDEDYNDDVQYDDALDGVEGDVKALVREEIISIMNRQKNSQYNDRKDNKQVQPRKIHIQMTNQLQQIQQRDEDEENYESDLEGVKKKIQYNVIEPQRYKLIGYNSKNEPIYKMTDLYLTNDLKVKSFINEKLSRIVFGDKLLTGSTYTSKAQNKQKLDQIIANWEDKQQQYFEGAKKNLMNEEQLEQLVVSIGDKKEDYFLYITKQKQKAPQQTAINLPLTHHNFIKNVHKAARRLAHQQYANIAEFESDEEKDKQMDVQEIKEKDQQKNQHKMFGEIKGYKRKVISKVDKNKYTVKNASDNNPEGAINEKIKEYFSYYNQPLAAQNALSKSIQDYNRIEYDLSNPNFFHPKISDVLTQNPQIRKMKAKQTEMKNDANISNTNIAGNQFSVVSGSMITGNKQLSLKPGLNNQGAGDDDNDTIQQRIQICLKSQENKQVFYHSQVATSFSLIKFSVNPLQFANYQRYSFPFLSLFEQKQPISLIKHKPKKNKGTELQLNTEALAAYKKFSKPQFLSLSNGQYAMIEYIEQNPLLMSSVGMCERMMLQINHTAVLQAMKTDDIQKMDLDQIQSMRDNPKKTEKKTKTFQQQCQSWRKIITDNFGENGKVYLWDNKRQGKLIGNPDNYGVALMDSTLLTVPIVKKTNKKTDFLLVRQGQKWYLRKIDSLYVSGQVEPKKHVHYPDSRHITNTFMLNYQRAFIKRAVNATGKVNIDNLRKIFSNTNDAGLKKVLKSLNATTEDNSKNYTIPYQIRNKEDNFTPQQICQYQKLQHSICQLEKVGIKYMRSSEKLKQILNIFFRRHIESLQKYAIAKMIKQQLQRTSWYLTQSFLAFKNDLAKIDLIGPADPTNGHGGYSYIKKPQKQRTEKEELQQRLEKPRVSGTTSDLRKLRTKQTESFLLSRGYTKQQVNKKDRWQLVRLAKQQKGTEYQRQEKQTKIQKKQNEKKQISKIFNQMLRNLNDETAIGPYKYGQPNKLTLDHYIHRERPNWKKKKEMIQLNAQQQRDQQEED